VYLERVREEERGRVAREIHDELGGMLTGLKMDVAQLRRASDGPDPNLLDRTKALSQAIDQIVMTVRRIASELRPAVLDDFGLLAAMEWQLDDFRRRSHIDCQWTCDALSR
jgi:signal transduction histidine kinase